MSAAAAIETLVAIAAGAARRLGPRNAETPRRRALDALLAAAGETATPTDVPGAAFVAEVIRRDRAFDPARDPWSFQLDARALPIAALLSRGAAAEAIALLAPPDGTVFLDAGGGLGDATRAFLATCPGGRAFLVDTPPILAAARRHLGADAERVAFIAADLRRDALPACDVALIANVLHLHSADDRAAIARTVSAAAKTVALKDIALADAKDGPLVALAFGLVTAIFGDGTVLAESELADLVRSPGRDVSVRRMSIAPECALVVARPLDSMPSASRA
ncbi:MAG: methyltransferase [Kofleriaceae bacterium]